MPPELGGWPPAGAARGVDGRGVGAPPASGRPPRQASARHRSSGAASAARGRRPAPNKRRSSATGRRRRPTPRARPDAHVRPLQALDDVPPPRRASRPPPPTAGAAARRPRRAAAPATATRRRLRAPHPHVAAERYCFTRSASPSFSATRLDVGRFRQHTPYPLTAMTWADCAGTGARVGSPRPAPGPGT